MKKLLAAVLVVMVAIGITACSQPKTLNETIYAAYGKDDGWRGVFRIDAEDGQHTRTIWYKDYYPTNGETTKQVGSGLFSKSKLNKLFSNEELDNALFCYCYALEGGSHDKVLMASVSRAQYDEIVKSSTYDTDTFYRYVTLTYAIPREFPDLQSHLK